MTPEAFNAILMGLAGTFVAGFVGWTVTIVLNTRADLSTFKLHVSETYLKKEDIASIKEDLKEFSRVLYEIAGKLGIHTRKD